MFNKRCKFISATVPTEISLFTICPDSGEVRRSQLTHWIAVRSSVGYVYTFLVSTWDVRVSVLSPNSVNFVIDRSRLIKESVHFVVRIREAMFGLAFGFRKLLRLRGVGFRFMVTDSTDLWVTVGFSHNIKFRVPRSLVFVSTIDERSQTLELFSLNREKMGELVQRIRLVRWPDIYKGKGIWVLNSTKDTTSYPARNLTLTGAAL